MDKKVRYWTTEEERFLLENCHEMSYRQIGNVIDRPYHSVRQKARKLGISKADDFKWISNNTIMKLYRNHGAEYIAKRYNKSIGAVRQKVHRLGEGGVIDYNSDSFSLAEVSRLLGVSHTVIKRTYIDKHGLKYKQNGKYVLIKEKDFIQFLVDNRKLWDATRCEKWYFEQYDWFIDKLHDDRRKHDEKRWGSYENDRAV